MPQELETPELEAAPEIKVESVAYNIQDIAYEILSVDDIGVKLGSLLVNNLGEMYGLEYLDEDTAKTIYSKVKADKPKYGTVAEALNELGIFDTKALEAEDFNYDSFIRAMLSTYQTGTEKTTKELIYMDSIIPGVFPFENNLDKIYRELDYTDDFTDLTEVYDTYGLLADTLPMKEQEMIDYPLEGLKEYTPSTIRDTIPPIPDTVQPGLTGLVACITPDAAAAVNWASGDKATANQ
ncbi:MAG: hypothetical protein KAS11_01410 [Candidatus Aenigmarchaeota archaeon]|nr:hypothetical protein [Candidatus Aenigmarchaeota archaeon]